MSSAVPRSVLLRPRIKCRRPTADAAHLFAPPVPRPAVRLDATSIEISARLHCGTSSAATTRPFCSRSHHTTRALPDRATNEVEDSSKPKSVFNLPTILTILRVLAIPVLIWGFYWKSAAAPALCTVVFIAAALTDFLDGYLARKMNASTPFGAFLDPVADKLMVAAVLILLSTQPIPVGPFAGDHLLVPLSALAIIGREITMSALREWAAALGEKAHKAVAVNNLGKWKTATQMVSLTMLLFVSGGADGGAVATASATAGPALLMVATLLTVWSLVVYFKGLWPFLTGAE